MFLPIALRAAILGLAFLFASCAGRGSDAALPKRPEDAVECWEGERSSILLLAGEDFPEESGIADLVALEYGLAIEKGRARVLYWPDTFDAFGASLRLLGDIARNEQPEIVVTVGAPPEVLLELNRIRDAFPEIKIASIFPGGEALAVEAVSDMVVGLAPSFAQEAGASGIEAHEAAALLLAAVFSMEMLKMDDGSSPMPAGALLKRGMRLAEGTARHAGRSLVPLFWEYDHAEDPDTGLRSRRHVLIRKAG